MRSGLAISPHLFVGCQGRCHSVGFIVDVVLKTAVYRVRQVCNGKPLPGASIEVFFEHASDPPADPLVHQLRLEADNSFCLQANPTAKTPG